MATDPHQRLTIPEYLAFERQSETRLDYLHFDTLLNPTLLVEVLSPSTAAYDRKTKALQYRSIPSLAEYILVAQDQIRIERWSRDGEDEWQRQDLASLEQILELPSI